MILVTGATGLLGTHVVAQLLASGHKVKAMYRRESGKAKLHHLLNFYYPDSASEYFNQLQWVKADILDLVDLEEAMKGCERVVHCAAMISFHRKDFNLLFEQNRTGTANVVNTALELGVKQLIHVSSVAAIGTDNPQNDPIRRESNSWNPTVRASGYSVSKFSAEKEVWRGIEEGLNAAIVNPSLIIGAGDWNESSLKLFTTIEKGLSFYTEGTNAFVDARDVAAIIERLIITNNSGERYIVAGTGISFKELITLVATELKVKAPTRLAGKRLLGIAWRGAWLWGKISGKRPDITKESARSARTKTVYSNEKLLNEFPDFQFTSLEASIQNAIKGRVK